MTPPRAPRRGPQRVSERGASGPARSALVLLAAGASERLGACKALVELGRDREGRVVTPLAHLLAAGTDWDGAPPLVITGKHHAEIAAALPPIAQGAENAAWPRGRTGGIALAARLRPGFDLCLAPVDVPLVSRAVFQALLAAWKEEGAPARGFLAPACTAAGPRPGRRFGHPIVVGRALALELARFEPDQPLSELRALAAPLLAVDVEDPSVLDDLDTASDLERMRAKFAP
ncbi:MAG: NTP transferase domain-containing protein [Planctomycetes bacterium]|nr:NTP transferase domain-containing protein [Planctomycetota bacterium]